MELNREQIIKALECCTDEDKKCTDCPRFGFLPCTKPLMTDALSLIKELTEEVESLKQAMEHEHASFMETFGELDDKCKRLTEENENFEKRLRHLLQSDFIASFDEVNIKTKEYFRDISEADELMDERDRYKRYYFNHCFDELIANKEADIKADTVRKMQERLKAKAKNNEWNGTICGEDIDQIAKEMEEAAYE